MLQWRKSCIATPLDHACQLSRKKAKSPGLPEELVNLTGVPRIQLSSFPHLPLLPGATTDNAGSAGTVRDVYHTTGAIYWLPQGFNRITINILQEPLYWRPHCSCPWHAATHDTVLPLKYGALWGFSYSLKEYCMHMLDRMFSWDTLLLEAEHSVWHYS